MVQPCSETCLAASCSGFMVRWGNFGFVCHLVRGGVDLLESVQSPLMQGVSYISNEQLPAMVAL